MSGDIVDDIIKRAIGAGMSDDAAARLEDYLRHTYGGDEVYVAKKKRTHEEARKRAVEQVQNGEATPREAADRNGISRRTMYRLVRLNKM